MIVEECLISKYGKTCLTNNKNNYLSGIIIYILTRTVENFIRHSLKTIKNDDIDFNLLAFS